MRLTELINDSALAGILEASPHGVLLSNNEGRVIYGNRAICALLGYSSSAINKKTRNQVFEEIKKNKKNRWGEVKCITRQGEILFLNHYSFTVKDQNDNPLTVEYLEEKLKQSLTEKEDITQLRMEHLLYQTGPVIIFSWSAEKDLPVQYVTENVSQLGYSAREFKENHHSFLDIIHSQDRQQATEEIDRYSKEGKNSFEQTFRLTKKDGTRIWAYNFTTVIRNDKGTATSYVGYILDISEIKYLETALRNREEKYRLISENMRDLITLHDPDWAYRYISSSVVDLLGYSPEDLLGTSPLDMIHPHDIARILKGVRQTKEKQLSNMRFQYRMRKADNSYTWFETILNPIHDDKGEVIQLQAASRDISEQKLMEKQVRSLVKFPEENPHPVIRTSATGEIIYANRASNNLLKYWGKESKNKNMLPDYWKKIINEVVEMQKPRSIELNIDEEFFIFSITPVPEEGETYIYGIDISDKHRQEQELYLTARIFETTLEGITVTDPEGIIQSVNPAFTRITGFSEKDALGENTRILKSDRHDESFYKEMWESLIKTGIWEGEIWNRRKSGETYPEWLSINAIYDDLGQIQNYVAVFTDITEMKTKEEKIRYQAFHDPLTGLPNRNLLNDRLEVAIHRSSRSGKGLALAFIDLDRFKNINDSLGHITGDFLLIEVATRLETCIREDDTIARIGGDEFVILLSEIEDFNEISIIIARVNESFIDPVKIDGHELFITPSIGISLYPQDGDTASEIFKNADIAMYEAKKKGGNSYHFYAEEMDLAVTYRLRIENKLHHAIKNNEFKILYQPLVEVKSGKIAGVEALIRWDNEKIGSIPPSDFIPLAEEMGLIVQINDFTMTQACKDIAAIHNLGLPEIYVSINMTAQQFFQGKIVSTIQNALTHSGLKPKHVTLEITENTVMDNAEKTIEIMKEIRTMGIRFSIDDFGTGYSSLSYLRRFPLDNLKIDKSFIDDLPHDEESAAIVRTIIALAQSLNLKTVAEGVEKAEQLQVLKAAGADYIQGYYFSQPVTLDKLIELIKKGPLK